MTVSSCRRILLATLLVVSLTVSGCLTLNPSVTAEPNTDPVFDTLSTETPWAGHHVRVTATLKSTPAASNVTTISVIGANNQSYTTVSVASGQTTVILWVPTNQNATLVATNSVNSTTLATLNVTTSGHRVF